MKKMASLFLAFALVMGGVAFAQAKETALSQFHSAVYDELSMDEIPDGALTEDLLRELEETQEKRIFDQLLPWLVEKDYLLDLHRSAYLDYEGRLWTDDMGSLMDLSERIQSTPAEELPIYTVHLTPNCTATATRSCNYFGLYFMSVETLFEPCEKCFPMGWVYDYAFSFGFEGANQMRIDPWTDVVPEKYDQPRSIVAYFDHDTDACLSVAVQYYKQGYTIVYQSDDFVINGIINHCARCDKKQEHGECYLTLENGLWHCRECGKITKKSDD